MNRRTLVALAATALPVLGLLAPTQAVAATAPVTRSSTVVSEADPGRDYVFARNRAGVSAATANRVDLRRYKVAYGLRGNTDAIAFTFTVGKIATGKYHQVYTGYVKDARKTTSVVYDRTTNKIKVMRGSKQVSCPSATASKGSKTVVLVAARSCFTGATKVQVKARTAIVYKGGTRVYDNTRLSSMKTLNSAALRSWKPTEKRGDVVYPASAGSDRSGESVDLLSVALKSDRFGVSVEAKVEDVSYFGWDVKQRYFVDSLNSNGSVKGTLTVTPNRTEDGTTTVTGTGSFGSCAAGTTFTVTNEVGIAGRVPSGCLSGSLVTFRVRSQSLTEADVVTGSDGTTNNQPVLLG